MSEDFALGVEMICIMEWETSRRGLILRYRSKLLRHLIHYKLFLNRI
ncbi:MAG: hypothetical protein BMS9Abin08_1669 [Gammaproteobacteria bacterium]|nr:MAG: hypothetical protein BMS9Abin08_1669 [Gammaproteobacteria bacterium]